MDKPNLSATQAGVDPSMASGGVARSDSTSSTDKRSEFRKRVGIKEDGDLTAYSLRHRIENAYRKQTHYYYLVASASHGMLWLQIGIGATLTALGTTNSNAARIAITVLGAVNTLLAGMLTFLKSRNQPNRALQFRNALRGVYDELWQYDAEMLCLKDDVQVDDKVDALWAKYKEARAEAEANYPDLWVSLGKLTKSHNVDKNASTQLDEENVPPAVPGGATGSGLGTGTSRESEEAAAKEPLLDKTPSSH